MREIEQQLADLTNNFKDDNILINCHSEEQKQAAVKIFRYYYDNVEAYDITEPNDEKMTWQIKCSNPKQLRESLLNEDDEDIELGFDGDEDSGEDNESGDEEVDETPTDEDNEQPEEDDDFDMDLSEFDDPGDEMDMSDENLDTIDDISEVEKADKITVLKKRAGDLGKKWKEIYDQIAELARAMDLTVTHDDDLRIELKKANGEPSKMKQDLNDIKSELTSDDNEEIDDDFGPSEYDARAAEFNQEPEPVKQESLEYSPQEVHLNESNLLESNDPNELPIREDEIDDDF